MPFQNNKNKTLIDESVVELVVGEVNKEKIVFSDLFTTTEPSATFSLIDTNYHLLKNFTISSSVPYQIGHKFVILEGEKLRAYRAIPDSPWFNYTQTDWDNLTQNEWFSLNYTIEGEIRCSLSILTKNII